MTKLKDLAIVCLLSFSYTATFVGQTPIASPAHSVQAGPFPLLGQNSEIPGQPFSLVEKITTTKTLADGGTVKREEQVRLMRDNEGRTRRETSHVTNGHEITMPIMVFDPIAHTIIDIRPSSKEAYVMHHQEQRPRTAEEQAQRAERRAKAEADRYAKMTPAQREEIFGVSLGQKNVAGVLTDGRRYVRVVPVGLEGNDRELRIVTESWVSPDLQISLESVVDDPVSGRTESIVTDLQRSDPDPAMFRAPDGYKVINQEMSVIKAQHQ